MVAATVAMKRIEAGLVCVWGGFHCHCCILIGDIGNFVYVYCGIFLLELVLRDVCGFG